MQVLELPTSYVRSFEQSQEHWHHDASSMAECQVSVESERCKRSDKQDHAYDLNMTSGPESDSTLKCRVRETDGSSPGTKLQYGAYFCH